jgi:putative ABC transport system ATP-binding protein
VADTIVIDARNVVLSLGRPPARVEILRGIDLSVRAGESVALLGPSGSGKSSLMAVLAGMERPSGGSARVAGLDFDRLDENGLAVARRGRIGIILQAFHLLPTMTAIENVAVPLELAGEGDAFARAEAELAAVGLGHRLRHYPAQLSGGEQQRVAIARAVANAPHVLLADEPTGNLDPETADHVFTTLMQLTRASGLAALIATHNMELAGRMDRRVTLRDGHIVEVA